MSKNTDLAHLRPNESDDIDLGLLIRQLFTQWPIIAGITAAGAILGVVIALTLSKQYRVEAVFDKPSTSHLSTLLSQPFIELTRQQLLEDFLKNIKSPELIESVMNTNNLLTDEDGTPLNSEQKYTTVSRFSNNLRVAPVQYDFIKTLQDDSPTIDQISVSVLSSRPDQAKLILDGLLTKAADKTILDILNDINGTKRIKLSNLDSQLQQLILAADAKKQEELARLRSALSVAEELNIAEPTTWEASSGEAYLKGTRILAAEIKALENSTPPLGSMVTGYNDEGLALTLTGESIRGQIGALGNYKMSTESIQFVSKDVKSQIPAIAEKPNRKLIAVASTMLAGVFGFFVALIRIAIAKSR